MSDYVVHFIFIKDTYKYIWGLLSANAGDIRDTGLIKYGHKEGRRIREGPRASSFSIWVTGSAII